MVTTNADTDYAVRVWLDDGTTEPPDTEEMDWVSERVARKIAGKAYDARVTVVNSPVVAIEIINAAYESVQIVRFDEDKEETNV